MAGPPEPREARPGDPSLSNSNNCTEGVREVPQINRLTGRHKHSAFALTGEVIALVKRVGIEHVGFLTLTFSDVFDIREANRRFHSLQTHFLVPRYGQGLVSVERQKRGAIHFHLVVKVPFDIRTGVDFQELEKKRWGSCSARLHEEWAVLRDKLPKYGFGRHELLPIKSTAEGIGRYVGKYIAKHVGDRDPLDKGARLWRAWGYKAGERSYSTQFSWAKRGGWLWRQKVAIYAKRVGADEVARLESLFGGRWVYLLRDEIMREEVSYASLQSIGRDGCFPDEETMEMELRNRGEVQSREYKVRHVVEERAADADMVSIERGGAPAGRADYQLEPWRRYCPQAKNLTEVALWREGEAWFQCRGPDGVVHASCLGPVGVDAFRDWCADKKIPFWVFRKLSLPTMGNLAEQAELLG